MKRITMLALLCLTISPGSESVAIAGRYKLLKFIPGGRPGQQFPISSGDVKLCETYEKILNSSPKTSYPFACGAPMNPKYKYINKPEWKSLDVRKYKNLIKKMVIIQSKPRDISEDKWENGFENLVNNNSIRLRLADLDIGKDKYIYFRPSNVPKYILEYDYSPYGPCDPTSVGWLDYSGGARYYVTNEYLTDVVPMGGLGWMYLRGVFTYNGAVYFEAFEGSSWNDRGSKTGEDNHYENYIYEYKEVVGQPAVLPICRYRYIEDGSPRQ